MASKYWIKLYHEVLHDPKMGLMPDNLWRRTIELFLLAGEVDQDGYLPCTSEIAWTLRLDDQELENELKELEKLRILQREGDSWLVSKFKERQAKVPAKERMRQMRERRKKDIVRVTPAPPKSDEDSNEVVTRTVTKRNLDTDIDKDSVTNVTGPPPKKSRLEPQTESELMLFELINKERLAKNPNWRRVTKFPSMACKEKYSEAAQILNGQTRAMIVKANEQGFIAIAKVVNYVAGCAKNVGKYPKNKPATGQNRQQRGTPLPTGQESETDGNGGNAAGVSAAFAAIRAGNSPRAG